MQLVVEAMELDDIVQVQEVDRESYTLPWPASAYRREVLHNRNAYYFVLRQLDPHESDSDDDGFLKARLPIPWFRWTQRPEHKPGRPGKVLGYAGMWLMIDEAHITTIAVRSAWRGKGLGELLLASLIEVAEDIGAKRLTLEVRVSNDAAQTLYRKYGFVEEGRRPRYYSDNNEDAYIMTTSAIDSLEFRATFDALTERLRDRLRRVPSLRIVAPSFPEPERAVRGQESE